MNGLGVTLGAKMSLSTNSSLYSTPCQSPGSLGSSLESTNISLHSKDSLTTSGPYYNGGLLAIQHQLDGFRKKDDSRPGSCSSGSSFSSGRTLLPPSSNARSSLTWKPEENNNKPRYDQPQSIVGYQNKDYWQALIQLRHDLTGKLSGLKQQVQLVLHQIDELDDEMRNKFNGIYQQINNDSEKQVADVSTHQSGIFTVPRPVQPKKCVQTISESRIKQLNELLKNPMIQKLAAIVKGYSTRRLMETSKVKDLIKTIKDTTILLDNYRSEEQVAKEEIEFHRRLMIQLEKSLAEFHDVFFSYTKSEQMKLISRSRDVAIERAFRLSMETRRNQLDKPLIKKAIHDKRKDSPVLLNPVRVTKQSKQDCDVEVKPAADKTEEVKTQPKAKPKPPIKPRKSAKNGKKTTKSTDSSSPPPSSSSSSLSTTKSTSSTISTTDESKTDSKESAPRRSKRAPTTKRVTRAAKKSS